MFSLATVSTDSELSEEDSVIKNKVKGKQQMIDQQGNKHQLYIFLLCSR